MNALFLKLLNMSAAGSVLILAVVLLRALLKKAPRWVLCAMWALAAIRLLCPVSPASPLSVFQAAPSVVGESGELELFRAAGGSEKPMLAVDTLQIETPRANAETITEIPGTSLALTQRSRDAYLPPLVQAYLLGLAAMLLYAAVSTLLLRKKAEASLRLERNVRLCDTIPTPFILGLFRPRIYLPSSLSEEERSFVLAHERAHLRRRDHWWKPLGFLILSVHWFNPFCWLAYVLLCRDIELACDEKVIRELGRDERAAYSQVLLNCSAHRILAACPVAFGETDVKARVMAVLHYKKPAFRLLLAAVLGCAVLIVCFASKPLRDRNRSLESDADVSFDSDEYLPLYQGVLDKYRAVLESASRGEAAPGGREDGDAEDYDALLGSWSESILVQHYFDRDPLGRVGWTLADLDGDRVPELLIGSVEDEEGFGTVLFDLYTLSDGVPVRVAQSFERFRYCDIGSGVLLEEASQVKQNYWIVWRIEDGELRFADGLIYDEWTRSGKGCWLGMAGASDWEIVPGRELGEEEALAWLEQYQSCKIRRSFTPFAAMDAPSKQEEPVRTPDSFMSRDGSTEYVFSDEATFVMTDLPVVEAVPHEITAEEAARFAGTLFPNAAYSGPAYGFVADAPWTKAELQASMARWRGYLTDGIYSELMGEDPRALADMELVLGRWEEGLAERLAGAPEEEVRLPAQWIFRPDSAYWAGGNAGTETLRVIADCGGLQYGFCAANQAGDGLAVHMLYGFLYVKSSPNNIDGLLQQYALCRSPAPTEAQLAAIEQKTRTALDALGVGAWQVDRCTVERLPRGREEAYVVTVTAVPVFQGVEALRFPQLSDMRSGTEGAQHYYFTDAVFSFAPDGTLLDFSVRSPLDLVDVRGSGGALGQDELLEAAKALLARRGLDFYGSIYPADRAASARIWIERMSYGLVRIEDEAGKRYRYVPALCLDGHVEFYSESGNLLLDSSTEGLTRMLVLNALDGTEIPCPSDA